MTEPLKTAVLTGASRGDGGGSIPPSGRRGYRGLDDADLFSAGVETYARADWKGRLVRLVAGRVTGENRYSQLLEVVIKHIEQADPASPEREAACEAAEDDPLVFSEHAAEAQLVQHTIDSKGLLAHVFKEEDAVVRPRLVGCSDGCLLYTSPSPRDRG